MGYSTDLVFYFGNVGDPCERHVKKNKSNSSLDKFINLKDTNNP